MFAKNGRVSDGKNSKRIKNRFFLITDKVAQTELEIGHMGTKSMWSDVNTKQLQVAIFRMFRSEMTGVPVEHNYDVYHRRTHPLILTLIETEILTLPDSNILEKITVVEPMKKVDKPGPVEK